METVAPHAGAWIETCPSMIRAAAPASVAPHAGAWIETLILPLVVLLALSSHPTRVRGLKPQVQPEGRNPSCSRTPRGCVD